MLALRALVLLVAISFVAARSDKHNAGKPLAHELMQKVRAKKEKIWSEYQARGYFDRGRWESGNQFAACEDRKVSVAGIEYRCKNLDVTGHLSHSDLEGMAPGSSIWGMTVEGHEYVAVGQSDGVAFAEVVGKGWWNDVPNFGKKEGTLDYLGRVKLPEGSVTSSWKEVKGYKHYAVIGSEAWEHGIQIFDLTQLLELRRDPLSKETKVFSTKEEVTRFKGLSYKIPFGMSHNVLASEASDHVILTGVSSGNWEDGCWGGMVLIDVSDPKNPNLSGCAGEDGYTHDAQCLIYKGPDKQYVGREICYAYNSDTLTIYDITNKKAPTIISKSVYPGVGYVHQGSILDPENQEYMVLDDELDEIYGIGEAADGRAVTHIMNITSLANPNHTGIFKSSEISIDHNQFVYNLFTYQSNYAAGLRILDVASIPDDPTGSGVHEVAYIDIFPDDDTKPKLEFVGTWGNTGGLFKSGHIAINTMDRGVFVVKRSEKVAGGFRAEF